MMELMHGGPSDDGPRSKTATMCAASCGRGEPTGERGEWSAGLHEKKPLAITAGGDGIDDGGR